MPFVVQTKSMANSAVTAAAVAAVIIIIAPAAAAASITIVSPVALSFYFLSPFLFLFNLCQIQNRLLPLLQA